MSRRPTNREALGLIAGFGLWSATFFLLYGGHGLVCAADGSPYREGGLDGARLILLAIWAAMLVAHAALIAWFLRRWRGASDALRFVRLASLTLAIAAFVATLWTGLPLVTLRLCNAFAS